MITTHEKTDTADLSSSSLPHPVPGTDLQVVGRGSISDDTHGAPDVMRQLSGAIALGFNYALRRLPAGLTAAVVLGSQSTAHADLEAPGENPALHAASGATFQQFVSGRTVYMNTVDQFGNTLVVSGILWDQNHVLTAAGNLSNVGVSRTVTTVGTGPNFLSDPGQSASAVSTVINSTWNFTHTGSSLDAAMITLDHALPGNEALPGGTPPLFDIYFSLGYGNVHTAGGSDLPIDGAIRMWSAQAVGLGGTGFSDNYIAFNYGANGNGSLPGAPWAGDFGGGVYENGGLLSGMNVGYSGGYGYAIRSDVLEPWAASVVPEPTTWTLLLVGGGIMVAMRRRK